MIQSNEIEISYSDNMYSDTVGGRIAQARQAADVSVIDLAKRIGVTGKTLSMWEADRVEPRANRLAALSEVLKVSPTWILLGKPEGSKNKVNFEEVSLVRADLKNVIEDLNIMKTKVNSIVKRISIHQS